MFWSVFTFFWIASMYFEMLWNVFNTQIVHQTYSNIIKPATTGRACPRSPPALGNTKRVHPNAAHIIPDGAVMTGSFCWALSSSQFMTKRAERIGKIWKHSEANLNKPKRHSHGTDRRIVIEPRDTAWPPNFPRFIPRRCGPHSTTWVSRCVNRFFMFFHVFSWLFSLFTVKKFKIYQYLFRNDSKGFICFRSNCECTPITYPWFLFKIVHTHSLFTIVLCYKYYKFI
jgi:hypothetical protein